MVCARPIASSSLQVRIVVVCRSGRDACGFVGPAVGLWFGAGAGWGADGFSALSAVVGAVAAVVGGGAGADFPADEACVGSECVPVGALLRWPFVAGHNQIFAHLFDICYRLNRRQETEGKPSEIVHTTTE